LPSFYREPLVQSHTLSDRERERGGERAERKENVEREREKEKKRQGQNRTSLSSLCMPYSLNIYSLSLRQHCYLYLPPFFSD
jgi:hypothetical protein